MTNVITAFTLPDQPPTGSSQLFALGGDGYRSPSAMYAIRNVQVVGDASNADTVSVQMGLDPTYCSLIGYASMSTTQATPASERVRWQMVGARIATMEEIKDEKAFLSGPPQTVSMWLPPALIIPGEAPGTLSFFMNNVATDLSLFNANIFLFNIRAREETPYDLLVAARGGI